MCELFPWAPDMLWREGFELQFSHILGSLRATSVWEIGSLLKIQRVEGLEQQECDSAQMQHVLCEEQAPQRSELGKITVG